MIVLKGGGLRIQRDGSGGNGADSEVGRRNKEKESEEQFAERREAKGRIGEHPGWREGGDGGFGGDAVVLSGWDGEERRGTECGRDGGCKFQWMSYFFFPFLASPSPIHVRRPRRDRSTASALGQHLAH